MSTKPGSFKDLPKTKAAPTIDELKKQLEAAQAALATQQTKPAPPAPAEDAEPVVIEDAGPSNPLSNPADFMAMMTTGGGDDTMAALTAALDTDAGGGGNTLTFPTLTQVGGTSGGPFTAIDSKNPDCQGTLPEGKRAFNAVFVAYRYLATIWPEAKSDGGKPIGSGVISASNGPDAALLMRSGKAFQFNRQRDRFGISNGGPGIPKPSLEFLLHDESTGGLFVLRTNGHYNSAKDARDQLLACAAQQKDGSMKLLPFFGSFDPVTHKQDRPGKDPIVHHYPKITKIDLTDARTGKAALEYKAFIAKADAAMRQRVTDWMAGVDAPLSATLRTALENAEALA